jgi:hypothetical protein
MNFKTIKDVSTIKLGSVKFDWIKEDGSIRELKLTDDEGKCVVIRTSDYGSLRFLAEAPEEPER